MTTTEHPDRNGDASYVSMLRARRALWLKLMTLNRERNEMAEVDYWEQLDRTARELFELAMAAHSAHPAAWRNFDIPKLARQVDAARAGLRVAYANL